MRGHFRHLHLKKIPMISWGPKFAFVYLFNQGFEYLGLSHECNFQNESALESHWVQFLAFCLACENVFHS